MPSGFVAPFWLVPRVRLRTTKSVPLPLASPENASVASVRNATTVPSALICGSWAGPSMTPPVVLTEARAKAHDKAAPILDRLAIGEPADLLLANPATEAPGDRRAGRFDFYYRSGLAGVSGSYELKVAKVALQAPAGCAEAEEPVVGMEASLRNTETGVARIIARDAAIPASRHCPTDYDIEAVYAPSSYGTSARNVALIGVYSRGFEGYNRSLIAIPFDALD